MEPEKTPRERAEDLIRLLVPDWRPNIGQGLWVIRIAIMLGILVLVGYGYGITLWDWLQLLIVPAAIAGIGLWFNQQHREREIRSADQRARIEREIADKERQDDILQTYLNQMGQLLLDKDTQLRQSKEGDEVRTLARARTLTVLGRLDGERKGSILQFLSESNLIVKERPIVSIAGADLREASLDYADLKGTGLRGLDLRDAVLSAGYLSRTDLSYSNLSRADLSFSQMTHTNLYKADLSEADLTAAILMEANLRRTDLRSANLSLARFGGVDLSGADLSKADLSDAKGITNEELERQAATLECATMPNGQKYEEWLQTREEDG